jgi:predicted nucleotidyltransferase
MTTNAHILQTLKAHKAELVKLGISVLGLFGSYLRNEQTPQSDMDVLIDFEPEQETFDNFMAVYDKLEDLFQYEVVKVVTRNGLSPYIGPIILKEVEYV